MMRRSEPARGDLLREAAFNNLSLAGNWQRKLSLVIAIAYLIIWPIMSRAKSAAHLMVDLLIGIICLALPLACIWFGDELGGFYYPDGKPDSDITAPSPGKLVIIGGWILLFLPVWLYLLVRLLVYLYVR